MAQPDPPAPPASDDAVSNALGPAKSQPAASRGKPLLTLQGLGARRGNRVVLQGIDLTVGPGEFIGLIGPNGAGKTSLLRAALGLMPCGGSSSLAALPARQRARLAAFLPQQREIAWPVSVERLVALGRSGSGGGAEADRQAVRAVLELMALTGFQDRPATGLSGGEQARVLLARALAQDTPLLLADEPTAGLDPAAQIAAMEVFAGLAQGGRSVVAALHDLALAARHCTRLILLQGGRLVADGTPAEVLAPALIAETFGIASQLEPGPEGLRFRILGLAPRTPESAGHRAPGTAP